ncbi:histidine kinase [Phytohabitans sp. LJ34]|uniref:sensor histidine kinase n=1 Tax=Phytohabitans sp. LJ34 TaxID=3452217 RepID=UPI003F89CCF8
MTVETADAATGVHTLRIGRAVVLAATGVLLALFAAGLVLWATHAGELLPLWVAPDGAWTAGQLRAVLAGWGVPVGWFAGYFILLELLLVAASVVAAWFVLRGALSWFRLYLVFVLVLFATAGGGVPLVVGELYPAVADPLALAQGVAWIALFPLAYVFPDGRFVPQWSRWLAVGWALWLAAVVAFDSTGEGPVPAALLLLLFGSCVAAQVYRYARVSGPVERLQIRWVLCAVALRFAYNVALVATPLGAVQDEATQRGLAVYTGLMAVSYAMAAALPAAIAVAIVRHRLFDIDVVISRTLVYGVLTAFVVGTYALVVGGVGALWRGGGPVALPLVATGLVAVAFSPLREQVQRRVNRLVYGERHDPYGVLSRLGRQLAGVVRPEAVAPAIVEAVARALKAPYVAVDVDGGVVASRGVAPAGAERFPLQHRGETVGDLVVGGQLSAGDRRLLADLAGQSGAALYAAQESARTRQLAGDLQRTREDLVAAREEERRRIRRDLHDSLGPALSGQALTIEAARSLLATDPAAADGLLRDLTAHSRQTLDEVRRLARQLRPPVLDELGLAAALGDLRERYRPQGLDVTAEVPPLPDLPAAVEVAVYRIVQEALTNVVRHAGAGTCVVSLAVDGAALTVSVVDDGRGIGSTPAGVGLASMRERAEELGGTLTVDSSSRGTTVTARLPLRTHPEGD